MQPIMRGHAADTNVAATQNLLTDKRYDDGVINIVVGCIAGRDVAAFLAFEPFRVVLDGDRLRLQQLAR